MCKSGLCGFYMNNKLKMKLERMQLKDVWEKAVTTDLVWDILSLTKKVMETYNI